MRQFLSVILITAISFGPVANCNAASPGKTATPIKHVVVIFQENVSFDHYFGTYPYSTNPKGEPRFKAPTSLRRLVSLGHLGRKTGRGYFEYATNSVAAAAGD
jgi:hypothetical protein